MFLTCFVFVVHYFWLTVCVHLSSSSLWSADHPTSLCTYCDGALSESPCLLLDCKHAFHKRCMEEAFTRTKPDLRVCSNFKVFQCPSCCAPIDHPAFKVCMNILPASFCSVSFWIVSRLLILFVNWNNNFSQLLREDMILNAEWELFGLSTSPRIRRSRRLNLQHRLRPRLQQVHLLQPHVLRPP